MSKEIYSQIISDKDVNRLLALSDDDKESFLIHLMYNCFCNMQLDEMNHAQRTLYLAMKLEDSCQADSLVSLAEEKEVFLALNDMKAALLELGAMKTAGLLAEFILLVPDNTVPEWSWFDERTDVIDKIDSEIGDYPDGAMRKLYVKYISKPDTAEEILSL